MTHTQGVGVVGTQGHRGWENGYAVGLIPDKKHRTNRKNAALLGKAEKTDN